MPNEKNEIPANESAFGGVVGKTPKVVIGMSVQRTKAKDDKDGNHKPAACYVVFQTLDKADEAAGESKGLICGTLSPRAEHSASCLAAWQGPGIYGFQLGTQEWTDKTGAKQQRQSVIGAPSFLKSVSVGNLR